MPPPARHYQIRVVQQHAHGPLDSRAAINYKAPPKRPACTTEELPTTPRPCRHGARLQEFEGGPDLGATSATLQDGRLLREQPQELLVLRRRLLGAPCPLGAKLLARWWLGLEWLDTGGLQLLLLRQATRRLLGNGQGQVEAARLEQAGRRRPGSQAWGSVISRHWRRLCRQRKVEARRSGARAMSVGNFWRGSHGG